MTRLRQGFGGQANKELESLKHKTIKKVTEDFENFHFNTAISALMEYLNVLNQKEKISKDLLETLIILLAQSPHTCLKNFGK